MYIKENYTGKSGVLYFFEYEDTDSFEHLPYEKCRQCYGVCFSGESIVIGYGGHKQSWGLIGGTIEKDETFEQTLRREIQEESNMEVIAFAPIGYQKAIDSRDNSVFYQLRFVCTVKPYGPFVHDPALAITEIKLIDPPEYKQYFDWGKIGERIMARAIELKKSL